jgi:predicted O-linked N-acetylglucosamine transferase (SPINDLY family)
MTQAQVTVTLKKGITSPEANRIIDLIERKDIEQAQTLCNALIDKVPGDPEALHMKAVLLQMQGQMQQAIETMHRAVTVEPGFEMGLFNLGVMLEEAGRFDDAINVYRHLLNLSPRYFQALFNLAYIFQRAGQMKDAEQYYRLFLEQTPYHSGGNCNLGAILINQGRFDEALPYCEKAVMLALDNVDARNNCGIVYVQRGDFAKAEKAFTQALKIKPDYEQARQNLELLRQQRANPAASGGANKLAEAVERGNKHLANREMEQAEQCYREALIIRPDIPEVLVNLGMALNMLRRFVEAEALLKRAISLYPDNADAYGNLGNLYKDCERCEDAVAAYRKALSLQPAFFEAWVNMGMMLEQLGRHDEAVAAYKKALDISPEKMVRFDPKHIAALSRLIIEQQQLCLWDGLAEYHARLDALVKDGGCDLREGYKGFLVSTMLSISDEPAQHYRNAVSCSEQNFGAIAKPYDPARALPMASRKDGKIRIGYASADYRQHATAYLISGLFEQHDRSRFEIYAYSYGINDKGQERKRIADAVDHFIDVHSLSDAQAAQRIAQDGIDILIDLKGYTRDHRLGILAPRPAPIQVHYLGHPGTIGSSFIDYFLADKIVAPPALQPFFSEKLVYLPGSYQVNDDKRPIAAETPTRAQCGLPESGFVFCSFNQNYKIMPDMFDVWMRLLGAVPGSVLWLYTTSDPAMDNLRMEAKKRGIESERLVFATFKPLASHLARLRAHADLFLDTFPVNAHTTASDALWCDVPIVTCTGKSFTARVAASLLTAVGMEELITGSFAEYEALALALALAQDGGRLKALKQKLIENKKHSSLFDTKATTRAIEAAYLEMIERHKQGKPPEMFGV